MKAVAVTAPTPGTVISRRQVSSVGLGVPQHAPVQGDELLARRPPDFEQCLDHFNQQQIAGDQLADTGFERSGSEPLIHQ